MQKIVINRASSFIGCAVVYDVWLVNKYVGKLHNGEFLEIPIDIGIHRITFSQATCLPNFVLYAGKPCGSSLKHNFFNTMIIPFLPLSAVYGACAVCASFTLTIIMVSVVSHLTNLLHIFR